MALSMGRRARVVVWAAAGVLGVGVITGVVLSQLGAASAQPVTPELATSPIAAATSPSSPGDHSPGTQPRGDRWGLGRIGGRELHGEFTVRTKSGATQVIVLQNGAVTSTSTSGGAETVTVKSTDGFTSTYAVTSTIRIVKNGSTATFDDLKAGDTVRVIGTSTNGTLTAISIRDGVPKARTNTPRSPVSPSNPSKPGGSATTT